MQMAINSIEYSNDKKQLKSVYSSSSKGSNVAQCRLMKFNFTGNGSVSSAASKRLKLKNNMNRSPYHGGDKLQLLSHLTEKKLYKKTEFVSSFPLAAKIYKANSDEFKLKKKSKKNKKSVLTLPNEPSVLPQSCTVSDMNDSEYLKVKEDKPKKRLSIQKKKVQRRSKEFEFYDRDAKYCSQVNIDLDCSSTDIIKSFKGDCKKKGKYSYNLNIKDNEDLQPHDVWAVLRNINRFQFNPSPPMSEDSIELTPRKKTVKKGKRKRSSVFETCRTEQYAYISSIDVDSKSRSSFSQSTIIDRITVIDNESEVNETSKKNQKKDIKSRTPFENRYKGEKIVQNKTLKSKTPQNNFEAICPPNYQAEKGFVKTLSKSKACCDTNDSQVLSNVVRKSQISMDLDGSLYNDDDSFRDSSCHNITTQPGFMIPSHSGSKNCIHSQKEKNNSKSIVVPVSYPKMCGTAKIVSSKGPELALARRQESPVRKPRLVTTMPSSIHMPKLTQTEIRRRLANIKFPIIILGKDQLSATIKVEPYDYPQFNGLDEHVWPFMLGWLNNDENKLKPEVKDNRNSGKTRNSGPTTKKTINYLSLNKHTLKDKKPTVTDKNTTISKKKDSTQIHVNQESKVESPKSLKPKPMRQFRDKMLKLLYKKKSDQNAVNNNTQACGQGDGKIITSKIDKIDGKNIREHNNVKSHMRPVAGQQKSIAGQIPTAPGKILMPSKHLWGKAKWANDFVENVIKKIKAGTYYNHDIKDSCKTVHNDSKEVSIQTALPGVINSCGDLTPKITIQRKKETLAHLPGFDGDLPQLEIKSMTRNQISVKHCVTNVMLQFDVTVPLESETFLGNIKRSTSCIPLAVTESKTRVFKCKARIVNAMLPAEICTIIPKVISKLENPDTKLALPPPVQKDNVNACLSTISELPTFEVPSTVKIPLLQHVSMAPELRLLADGQFFKNSISNLRKPHSKKKIDISVMGSLRPLATELLSKKKIIYYYYFETCPVSPLPLKSTKLGTERALAPESSNFCTDLVPFSANVNAVSLLYTLSNVDKIPRLETSNICTDLVPLLPSMNNKSLPQSLPKNLFQFVLQRMPNSSFKFDSGYLPSVMLKTFNNNVVIDIANMQEVSSNLSINATNLTINSLYYALSSFLPIKNTTCDASSPVKCIEYIKDVDKTKTEKNANDYVSPNATVPNKHRKKKFVRLYKKCKSTSQISAEKMSTPLTRITNLEEFFQALGAAKLLSSVLDGYSGRKILASIIEMKNWITEITQRQALMVLLLANKKDTSNLVRFRPVILQGIAVNRITRASELDMEIEVIEREKFTKLTEHDGSLHLSVCANNKDNLLEELYWIAKTTASDYQKPFDESSEKLLRALLEKRKKLNPSYLRVMARYVGLGLLKSPVKSYID